MILNYYDLLGVCRDASPAAIDAAYRRLAREYHPDLNATDPEAKQKFQQIEKAASVLRDPDKRRRYDDFLNAAHAARGGRHDSNRPFSGSRSRSDRDQQFRTVGRSSKVGKNRRAREHKRVWSGVAVILLVSAAGLFWEEFSGKLAVPRSIDHRIGNSTSPSMREFGEFAQPRIDDTVTTRSASPGSSFVHDSPVESVPAVASKSVIGGQQLDDGNGSLAEARASSIPVPVAGLDLSDRAMFNGMRGEPPESTAAPTASQMPMLREAMRGARRKEREQRMVGVRERAAERARARAIRTGRALPTVEEAILARSLYPNYGARGQHPVGNATHPGANVRDYAKPGVGISGNVVYTTLPGTDFRDYSKPAWTVLGDYAYPTLPGTDIRDYSKAGIRLPSVESR